MHPRILSLFMFLILNVNNCYAGFFSSWFSSNNSEQAITSNASSSSLTSFQDDKRMLRALDYKSAFSAPKVDLSNFTSSMSTNPYMQQATRGGSSSDRSSQISSLNLSLSKLTGDARKKTSIKKKKRQKKKSSESSSENDYESDSKESEKSIASTSKSYFDLMLPELQEHAANRKKLALLRLNNFINEKQIAEDDEENEATIYISDAEKIGEELYSQGIIDTIETSMIQFNHALKKTNADFNKQRGEHNALKHNFIELRQESKESSQKISFIDGQLDTFKDNCVYNFGTIDNRVNELEKELARLSRENDCLKNNQSTRVAAITCFGQEILGFFTQYSWSFVAQMYSTCACFFAISHLFQDDSDQLSATEMQLAEMTRDAASVALLLGTTVIMRKLYEKTGLDKYPKTSLALGSVLGVGGVGLYYWSSQKGYFPPIPFNKRTLRRVITSGISISGGWVFIQKSLLDRLAKSNSKTAEVEASTQNS